MYRDKTYIRKICIRINTVLNIRPIFDRSVHRVNSYLQGGVIYKRERALIFISEVWIL